jgi:ATP phosphoribosyltransferase regulatory subunit
MMVTSKNKQLLPKGFADQLPPEADREAAAIGILSDLYRGFGYKRIKPPLVEFEDSLFASGPGAALPQETFRVLDPQSYKMMGVRSDITPQIARIARARLSDLPRPLRLTYANDVLRTRANQHRTARQFCKVGCEIIGNQSIEADHELYVLAIMGLKKLGISDITLDLTLPCLLDQLFTKAELTFDLKAAIDNRDTARIQDLLEYGAKASFIVELIRHGGDVVKTLTLLNRSVSDETAIQNIKTAEKLIELLFSAFDDLDYNDVKITLDPLERKGFEYHKEIGFSLFAKGSYGELGRGGRYILGYGDDSEHACGFTLYMDSVGRAMPAAFIAEKEPEKIEANTSWKSLEKRVSDGCIIVRDI